MTISCVAHIINCLQKPSLIRLCQERFLNSSGNKPRLRGRLKLSFVKKPIEVLSLLSIEELKLICGKSELNIDGTINQLIDHIMGFELCKHNKTVDENESSSGEGEGEDEDEGEGYSIDSSNEEVMKLTVKEILNGEEGSDTKNCVYLVYDGKDQLYIGKCEKMNLYDRFQLHMGKGPFYEMIKSKQHQQFEPPPQPEFSKALQKAGESALAWTVEILTLDECNKIFDEIDWPLRRKLKKAENAMIKIGKPKYNIQGHPDHVKPNPFNNEN